MQKVNKRKEIKMEINLGELIDTEIRLIENPETHILAQVKWTFGNGELKWGTISTSKIEGQKYWVQLPKFKCGGFYITPLMIKDSELEKILFNAALKKFTGSESSLQSQMMNERSKDNEEINLDDIPFS